MGRPYAKELEQLGETYVWALGANVDALSRALQRSAQWPLVAVGSGGSLTTASLMAQLHRRCTGALALTTTPLQLDTTIPEDARAAVWLLSAGGRNEDIRRAFESAVRREPRQLGVLCGNPSSPLVESVLQHSWVESVPIALPTKDGFLATNSALAFALLLTRAYAALVGSTFVQPTLNALLDASVLQHEDLDKRCRVLWSRSTLIVLHGASTATAAVDLESRFTEAALGLTQLADYRNFAHGRHHWLAKHPDSSAVLALVGPEETALARATLKTIPKDVPSVIVEFQGSFEEILLASLVAVMRLAGAAGIARGIDPGRPGVPEFGRRLYHMKTPGTVSDKSHDPASALAITRKARCGIGTLRARGTHQAWADALAVFEERIGRTLFTGLVCDYDGTLIEGVDRDAPPSDDVVRALVRLVDAGIVLGVATGRGDSVWRSLRKVIAPKQWARVIIGYHNGGVVQSLDEDPDLSGDSPLTLFRAAEALEREQLLHGIANVRRGARQITVRPSPLTGEDQLWFLVTETIRRAGIEDVRIVRSSHSVDVISLMSSKLHVLAEVRKRARKGEILSIGDRGCWPGNDYELLSNQFALSVDQVSPDPDAAWNLAPPGARGVEALVAYLGTTRIVKNGFHVEVGKGRR